MTPPRIPEGFLRYAWEHRLFSSSSLFTTAGVRVSIRCPGTANRDGGPDFTGASVRIGGVLYHGDVELHIHPNSWRSHGHCTDPHYNRVILHVVLLAASACPPPRTASGRTVPVLVLSPHLKPGLYDRWARECRKTPPIRLPCATRGAPLPMRLVRESILVLGWRRINRRVRLLHCRLRQIIAEEMTGRPELASGVGRVPPGAWEQLFYECLLEGMGYAKNRFQFLALARSVPLSLLRMYGLDDARTVQALLFTAAGLLPPPGSLHDRECRTYVRMLQQKWQTLSPPPTILRLHEADWLSFRLRPFNIPTARLAAACVLLPTLFASPLMERLLAVLSCPAATPHAQRAALVSLFKISPKGFWLHHLHFRGARRTVSIALGRERAHELILNGVLPLLLLYARAQPDRAVHRKVRALLCSLPHVGGNTVARLVRAALIGRKSGLNGPVEQQGLLHLYKVYCSHVRCGRCPVRGEPGRYAARRLAGGGRAVRMLRQCSPERTSKCSLR
jgi:hypothetical protein